MQETKDGSQNRSFNSDRLACPQSAKTYRLPTLAANVPQTTVWSQPELDCLIHKLAHMAPFRDAQAALFEEKEQAWTADDDDGDYNGPPKMVYQPKPLPSVKMTVLRDTPESYSVEVENVSVRSMADMRRSALRDLPSMSIETVLVIENNAMQSNDEWLAHRLGLLSLRVDPRLFDDYNPATDKRTSRNTLVFSIDIQCMPKPNAPPFGSPEECFEHTLLLGSDVTWHPIGDQVQIMQADAIQRGIPYEPASIVHPEGSVCRLSAGQRIHIIALAHKGTGAMHAKYSPIAAPTFLQYPNWEFSPHMVGARAEALVKACPAGVFGLATDVEDLIVPQTFSSASASATVLPSIASSSDQAKTITAQRTRPIVVAALNCTLCQECYTLPEFRGHTRIVFSRDRIVFSFDSNGILPAREYWKMLLEINASSCLKQLPSVDPRVSTSGFRS